MGVPNNLISPQTTLSFTEKNIKAKLKLKSSILKNELASSSKKLDLLLNKLAKWYGFIHHIYDSEELEMLKQVFDAWEKKYMKLYKEVHNWRKFSSLKNVEYDLVDIQVKTSQLIQQWKTKIGDLSVIDEMPASVEGSESDSGTGSGITSGSNEGIIRPNNTYLDKTAVKGPKQNFIPLILLLLLIVMTLGNLLFWPQ